MNAEAEAEAFWAIVYASTSVPNQSVEETLRYCRGVYAHALDLIIDQKFKRANEKLYNLTYLIDCVKFNPELQDIQEQATAWIRQLDEPTESRATPAIAINFELPKLED